MPLIPRLIAEQKARQFITTIQDVCQEIHICGSIRRLDSRVKDIDLVIMTEDSHSLWQHLDEQANLGIIERGDRWGLSHRSLIFKGTPIEIYTCDQYNKGYIFWLRTGPAAASHYVMSQLVKHQSSVRFQAGYAWHVAYDDTNPAYDKKLGYAKLAKLKTDSEWEFFGLIGLQYIAPPARNEISYGQLHRTVTNPTPKILELVYYIEPPSEKLPKQQKLF